MGFTGGVRFSLAACFLCVLVGIPPISAAFSGWNTYWSSWVGTQYYPTMYPFGTSYYDHKQTQMFTGFPANLNFSVPYYGRVYKDISIGMMANLQLSTVRPAEWVLTPSGVTWPYDQYPNQPDPAFMAPYYSTFQMYSKDWASTAVYWRVLDARVYEPGDVKIEVTQQMLWTISLDVRGYTVGAENFNATYGLIVTWQDITFYGCTNGNCSRNTLQAAVVTDEVRTYAVFNYYNLTWVGSTLEKCSPYNGRASDDTGATYPDCFGPAVGFNAGEARGFTALPYSYSQSAFQLQTQETSGVPNVRGRHLWEVSSYQLVRGGCTTQASWNSSNWPMEAFPWVTPMLGGWPLFVSGPCFGADLFTSHQVVCSFNGTVVPANVIPDNTTKAACVPPVMFGKGNVTLGLSIDGGATWPWQKGHFLVQPGELPPLVFLQQPDQWYSVNPATLRITWDPALLLFFWEIALKNPNNIRIAIELYMYREWKDGDQAKSEWRLQRTFDPSYDNVGTYDIDPTQQGCQNVGQCGWGVPLPVGLISIGRISPPDSVPDTTPWVGDNATGVYSVYKRMWSEPLPLGWYMNPGLTADAGDSWPTDMCKSFYNMEKGDQDWTNSTLPCPYSAAHAAMDPRFILMHSCNYSTNSSCMSGSLHHLDLMAGDDCYVQVTQWRGRQPWSGSSKCCYKGDGNLVYAGDSVTGSDANKVSRFGISPYNASMTVPSLSHWVWDKTFKLLCCNWTGSDSACNSYFAPARPTKDMVDYLPPGSAMVFGDPHFLTWDNLNYTFNGYGEYWLLYCNQLVGYENMKVQGRFIQPANQTWGETQATVLTAIVAQEGITLDDDNAPVIEAVLDYADGMGKVLILVDGVVQNFSMPEKRVQEFLSADRARKTVVMCHGPVVGHNDMSNFSIIHQNGVGLEITAVLNSLQARVTAPRWPYLEKVTGLAGWWNGDPDKDLVTPTGMFVNPDQSLQAIHSSFGEKWRIAEADSIFAYRAMMDYGWFQYPNFFPDFELPPPPPGANWTVQDVYRTCGENFPCAYDYSVMNSAKMATATLAAYNRGVAANNNSDLVPVCSYLSLRNSVRDVTHYLVGGEVQFQGCISGWKMTGNRKFVCKLDENRGTGYWSQNVNTNCMTQSAYNAAIAVPCCVVGVAIIVLIVLLLLRHHKKKKEAGGKQTTTQAQPHTSVNLISSPMQAEEKASLRGSSHSSEDGEPYARRRVSQENLQNARYTPIQQTDDDFPRDPASESNQLTNPQTESSQVILNEPIAAPPAKIIVRTVPAHAVSVPMNTNPNANINIMHGSNNSLDRVAYTPRAGLGSDSSADSSLGPPQYRPPGASPGPNPGPNPGPTPGMQYHRPPQQPQYGPR